jgi:hypothetical protein
MSAAHPRTASVLGLSPISNKWQQQSKTCEIVARCAPVLEFITIKQEKAQNQINTLKQLTAFRANELTMHETLFTSLARINYKQTPKNHTS